jgi:Xaa-Pro aminopeptidase
MFDLDKIQAALKQFNLDGWLLYDFRGSNVLARRVLDLDDSHITSRRFLYFIPVEGTPQKLVHRIESGTLDHLPGNKTVYLRWQELEAGIQSIIGSAKQIGMEYSPRNGNPYISKVDAGTIELVKSFGVNIVPSGDLIQLFEATWTTEQWDMHLEADCCTTSSFDMAWKFIAQQVRSGGSVEEVTVQQRIMQHFADHNMVTSHAPIVAVGPHSGDPHYETGTGENTAITEGSFVLIDQWCKLDKPNSVYSDLTRTGYVGSSVPDEYTKIFNIVAAARDAAINCVKSAYAQGQPLQGWQVDQSCRDVIDAAGYGEFYVHRTGHSIGQETHGNGANIDNLETHEERLVLPGTCFSIEPGIYLPEFGVRSEINVFIDQKKTVHVTGGPVQTEVVSIV